METARSAPDLPIGQIIQAVTTDELPTALQQACYGQTVASSAPVTFIWTAIPARTEWKYGPLAHRMIALEAGHIGQNLYLAAEALHLGTCCMLAYDQSRMDALLGVDGRD